MDTNVQVTPEIVKQHGLNEEEYKWICDILKREPNITELGIYSVMWSEHCSYKNSVAILKTLPTEGDCMLSKTGEENAGAVDIGDNLAVVFKIESHNHPSAVEPYQGAATGVGGIVRDIFTMGARPLASLNSLRFGDLDSPRVRHLFSNVVKGIGDYGNCLGIPTIGGEVCFADTYTGNPLVNAMTIGVAKHKYLTSATASGKGNPVLIVGASTGRDGIHGATFASEELSEESEEKRSAVQVGDPFLEKLLLEASLELCRSGYLIGMQDMGAAGITCSTSEMSARGGCGMRIDISKVPMRETEMTPYEVLLSESQERMLVVAKRENLEKIHKIFDKWDLHSVQIGEVTDDGLLTVYNKDEKVAQVPAETLVLGGGAPVYHRESERPAYLDKVAQFDAGSLTLENDCNSVLLCLLSSPNIASKRWVYRQYDHMVRTNTVIGPGGDAALIRIKDTKKGLAASTDCNARYCYIDPHYGGRQAVAESARNVSCTGAKPLAITNCLNFGNPYKPDIFWQFKECVAGMGDACTEFNTPVTGGNVSFYNENPESAIYPTPVVGMVGLIDDVEQYCTIDFKKAGDVIAILGETRNEIGGSEYLEVIHGQVAGPLPVLDLEVEKKVQETCREMIKAGLIQSAHDVSDGGLAVCLAESCMARPKLDFGVDIKIDPKGVKADAFLFGESQSRIVISFHPDVQSVVEDIANEHGVPISILGKVDEGGLNISTQNHRIMLELDALVEAWRSIENRMETPR